VWFRSGGMGISVILEATLSHPQNIRRYIFLIKMLGQCISESQEGGLIDYLQQWQRRGMNLQ
jgi:hypothetical protein